MWFLREYVLESGGKEMRAVWKDGDFEWVLNPTDMSFMKKWGLSYGKKEPRESDILPDGTLIARAHRA